MVCSAMPQTIDDHASALAAIQELMGVEDLYNNGLTLTVTASTLDPLGQYADLSGSPGVCDPEPWHAPNDSFTYTWNLL